MNNPKRLITMLLALLILTACVAVAATTATQSVTAENQWTTATLFKGRFNVSISGTWVATVHLQRSYDEGSTWVDVDSFTSNYEGSVDEPQSGGLYYRIGVKTGNFTSGTVTLRITK